MTNLELHCNKFYYYLRNTKLRRLYYEAVTTETIFTKINKRFPAFCSQIVLHAFATFSLILIPNF